MAKIPRNVSKDIQEIIVVVFGIKIDISCFIVCLLKKKLKKTSRENAKVLGQKSVNFINIQLFAGFFLFCL